MASILKIVAMLLGFVWLFSGPGFIENVYADVEHAGISRALLEVKEAALREGASNYREERLDQALPASLTTNNPCPSHPGQCPSGVCTTCYYAGTIPYPCCAAPCVTSDTPVRMSDNSIKTADQVAAGDYVMSQAGAARVEYVSRTVIDSERAVYGVNGGPEFFTDQHELLTADGSCTMIDAEGWLAKTRDYACKPTTLTAGTTLLMENMEGQIEPVVVNNISSKLVPANTPLYNIYLSSGWSLRGNGIVLSEPSRVHMREWYTHPARHGHGMTWWQRINTFIQVNYQNMATPHKRHGNEYLYAVQDQLFNSHAIAVQSVIDALPEPERDYALNQLIDAHAHGLWKQAIHDTTGVDGVIVKGKPAPQDNIITSIGNVAMNMLWAAYDHVVSLYTFVVYSEWMQGGQRVVWRDGVKYPAMYEYLFQLIKHSRHHITTMDHEWKVQQYIHMVQNGVNGWYQEMVKHSAGPALREAQSATLAHIVQNHTAMLNQHGVAVMLPFVSVSKSLI